MPDPASYLTGVEALAFAVDTPAPKGASLLDGPPTPDAPAQAVQAPQTSQVPQAPQVAQTAASAAPAGPAPAAAGKRLASLDAGASDHPDLFSDPAGDAAPAAPMRVPPAHPRIYDASENTSFDPLRNRSFDLNTAKSIPVEFIH